MLTLRNVMYTEMCTEIHFWIHTFLCSIIHTIKNECTILILVTDNIKIGRIIEYNKVYYSLWLTSSRHAIRLKLIDRVSKITRWFCGIHFIACRRFIGLRRLKGLVSSNSFNSFRTPSHESSCSVKRIQLPIICASHILNINKTRL